MINNRTSQSASGLIQGTGRPEELRRQLELEIERLRKSSNSGFFALSIFLMVCMAAWSGFSMLPSPAQVTSVLGAPPSSQMISIALLLYTFSAIILSLSRMMGGVEHRNSFSHVGYLTGFLLFYHYANGLEDNYWAVFGAGITILGVESYRIWTFCNEQIVKKVEQLDYIRRTGRLPLDED